MATLYNRLEAPGLGVQNLTLLNFVRDFQGRVDMADITKRRRYLRVHSFCYLRENGTPLVYWNSSSRETHPIKCACVQIRSIYEEALFSS